ncbi:hypothetical protein HZS_5710 [Henneguya salminicola]|nr:hypothetical protein HZS_5710 [Henneguya salminicola]
MVYSKEKLATDLKILNFIAVPSMEQLKFQFRTLASNIHPKRNCGNYLQFSKLSFAYQRLCYICLNPECDFKSLNFSYHHPIKLYDKLYFGKYRSKIPKIVKTATFTLRQLYHGSVYKVNVKYSKICPDCMALRYCEDNSPCPNCAGSGYISFYEKGNYDFYNGQGLECYRCRGDGECQLKDRGCKTCEGVGRVSCEIELEVKVDKGSKHMQKILTPIDTLTDYTGDYTRFYLIVLEMKDEKYTRKGNDLYTELTITLRDALTGVDQLFTTLDNRKLRIQSPPEMILKPDQKIV